MLHHVPTRQTSNAAPQARNRWGHDGAVRLELTEDGLTNDVIVPLKRLLSHLHINGPLHARAEFGAAMSDIDEIVYSPLHDLDEVHLRESMNDFTAQARGMLARREAEVAAFKAEKEMEKSIIDRLEIQTNELRFRSSQLSAEISNLDGMLGSLARKADEFESCALQAVDIQQWCAHSMVAPTTATAPMGHPTPSAAPPNADAAASNAAAQRFHPVDGGARERFPQSDVDRSLLEMQKLLAEDTANQRRAAEHRAMQDHQMHADAQRGAMLRSTAASAVAPSSSGERLRVSISSRSPPPDGGKPPPSAHPPQGASSRETERFGSNVGVVQAPTAPTAVAAGADDDSASQRLCKWEQGECVFPRVLFRARWRGCELVRMCITSLLELFPIEGARNVPLNLQSCCLFVCLLLFVVS